MPKYRYVGDHADTVQKGDTAIPVAPGDYVELTKKEAEEDDHNKELALIPAEGKGE